MKSVTCSVGQRLNKLTILHCIKAYYVGLTKLTCLFVLMLYVPVNNFSVLSGCFLG